MSLVNKQHLNHVMLNPRKFCQIILCVFLGVIVNNMAHADLQSKTILHQVEISSFTFKPQLLKVNIGDSITWTNNDIVPHNIIDGENQKILSPEIPSGATFTYIVKKPMSYQCGLHPSMKGSIVFNITR
ncbi:MAG: plastocyanin/azurin family copper-binding protein [Methylococcales bacterium]